MIRHSLLAVAVTALFCTTSEGIAILTSFEELSVGDPAAVGTPSGGGPIGVVATSPGVTDGSQAAVATNSTGFYDKIASVLLQGLLDTSVELNVISVDWSFDPSPGSGPGGYNGYTAAIGGGGTTVGFTPLNVLSGNEFRGTDSADMQTVIYEISDALWADMLVDLGNGENLQLELFSNKDGNQVAGTYTVDNILIDGAIIEIPEPSTLALCGLGIAGLVARRRR
ncbi:MAG: PEP-CTERM sorting domain-containing protein [Planctomycetota bacterium]